ncbi:hypothetical protein DFQ26_001354, partial [Actinomortierella ambigua]
MASTQIRVFTSDVCLLHAPTYEFHSGAENHYHESPDRLTAIAKWLESRPEKRFVLSKDIVDHGMAPIQKIHKPDFLEYLQTIYDEWVQEGGHPHGVAPATVPHQRLARLGKGKPQTAAAKSGEYCFDLSAVIMKETWRASYESAQVTLTAA